MLPDGCGLPGDVCRYLVDGDAPWSARAVAAGEILAGLSAQRRSFPSRVVAAVRMLLGKAEGDEASHASILSYHGGYQYEAVFPWAMHSKIDFSRQFEIWRICELTNDERHRILDWCRAKTRWLKIGPWWIGHPYNLVGVLTGGIVRLPGTYFCSQYDGMAYQSIGRGFGDDIMSPDGIPNVPGAKKLYTHIPRRYTWSSGSCSTLERH